MIAIVDYGMGNLGSVKRKLDQLGVKSSISNKPEDITNADKVILPGVGHFGKAVYELKTRGLWDALKIEVSLNKKPVLGICLGMQLMARFSEEGNSEGFGWFDAKVVKFQIKDKLRNKVPHTGWNSTSLTRDNLLFKDIPLKTGFYFVHSFHLVCSNKADILTESFYEYDFVSSIHRNNIYGVQFHPEKSHDEGIQLLQNFVNI